MLQYQAFGCGERQEAALNAGQGPPGPRTPGFCSGYGAFLTVLFRAGRGKAQGWCKLCGLLWKGWINLPGGRPVCGDPVKAGHRADFKTTEVAVKLEVKF